MNNTNNPIFIIGIGRSGTTLLMSMLNTHPKIAFPPETHFFRHYVISGQKENKNKIKKLFLEDKYLQRLSLNTSDLTSSLPDKKHFNWGTVYRALLKEYQKKEGVRYVGDKDPKNIEYLPSLYNFFPNSEILHIIRDPRDVFLSRQKADWSKGKHWFTQIMAYRIQYKLGRKNGKKYFGDNYHEVQYENLITQPKKTLEKICENFLSISYDSRMLQFGDTAREIISKEEKGWKKEAMGPLLSNNYQKWKNNLSRSKIVIIETLCNKVFQDGLYKKAYLKITFLEKLRVLPLFILASIGENFYKIHLKLQQKNFD